MRLSESLNVIRFFQIMFLLNQRVEIISPLCALLPPSLSFAAGFCLHQYWIFQKGPVQVFQRCSKTLLLFKFFGLLSSCFKVTLLPPELPSLSNTVLLPDDYNHIVTYFIDVELTTVFSDYYYYYFGKH